MTITYVNKRIDLTLAKESASGSSEVYRVRTECGCPGPHNRRDGILIVESDKVVNKVIRCKSCRKGVRP